MKVMKLVVCTGRLILHPPLRTPPPLSTFSASAFTSQKKIFSYREHGRRQRQRQANINDAPEFLRWCRRQRNVDDVDYDTRVRMRTDDEELRKIETNNSTFTVLTIDYYAEDDWEELGSGHW